MNKARRVKSLELLEHLRHSATAKKTPHEALHGDGGEDVETVETHGGHPQLLEGQREGGKRVC